MTETGPMALRITEQGLEAIEVEGAALAAPTETSVRPAPAHAVETPAAGSIASPSGFLATQKSARRSITGARPRPRRAPRTAGRARSKPACS